MSSILSKLANYDEFDTAMESGGGTKTYWRGLQKIVPGGKDDMLRNPDGLGGNRTRQIPGKLQKDSFKKKGGKPEHSMKKVAIKFSAGTVAGPKSTMKQMGKVTSGFPMSKIFKTTSTKPISGSAQMMVKTSGDKNMNQHLISGFADEIEKNARGGAKHYYGMAKRVVTGKGGVAKQMQKYGPAKEITGDMSRAEAAKRFGKSIKRTAKKHKGKLMIAGGAGAAGTGAAGGYMYGKSKGKGMKKEAGIGAAIKGVAKGIYGAGKAGISAGKGAVTSAKQKAAASFGKATVKQKTMAGAGAGAKEFGKRLTKGQAAGLAATGAAGATYAAT